MVTSLMQAKWVDGFERNDTMLETDDAAREKWVLEMRLSTARPRCMK